MVDYSKIIDGIQENMNLMNESIEDVNAKLDQLVKCEEKGADVIGKLVKTVEALGKIVKAQDKEIKGISAQIEHIRELTVIAHSWGEKNG